MVSYFFQKCKFFYQFRFEFGMVDYDSKTEKYKVWPLDIEEYKTRQKKLRYMKIICEFKNSNSS